MYRAQTSIREAMRFPKQQGAALVVSLLLLLVMTILALSATQTTRMQERMAGNTRDSDLAFQSAEAGLRAAEDQLWGWTTTPTTCTTLNSSCLVYPAATIPFDLSNQSVSWWANNNNTNEFGASGTQELPGVVADPRYTIEEFAYVPDSLTVGRGPPTGKTYYRNTARSNGGTNTSQVIVQSTFTKRY